jgi:type VI secretion system protein ImpA
MELSAILAPVADADPCGPDLDEAGDPDFLAFMARIETILPETFFAFDRASIDFKQEHGAIDRLLARSRDLRLLVIKTKLAALDRKLDLFAETIAAIAALLKERWDDTNPKTMGEDAGFRGAMLASLDDMPQIVMPLQSMPLVNTRRAGWISFRQHLISSGRLEPREAEADTDFTVIGHAIRDIDLDAKASAHAAIAACLADVKAINSAFSSRPGGISWLRLERLPGLLEEIASFLAPEDALAAGLEAVVDAEGVEQVSASAPAGPVRSRSEAGEALAAVGRYFAAKEPSSAAWPLVRQSQDLLGKSFFDIVQALMPDKFDQARIKIGRETGFALPLQMLASRNGPSESSEEETSRDAGVEEEASAEDGEAHPASDDTVDEPASAPARPALSAATRAEAIALLGAASAYLRSADPSNPVPLLLDHARSLVGREFIDLMRQMLPHSSLDMTETEN